MAKSKPRPSRKPGSKSSARTPPDSIPEVVRARALAETLHDLIDVLATKLIPEHGLGDDRARATIGATDGIVQVRMALEQLGVEKGSRTCYFNEPSGSSVLATPPRRKATPSPA